MAGVRAHVSSHPSLWTSGKLHLEGRELAERSINLEPSPCSRPSMLRILRQALSPEEVNSILDMFRGEMLSTTEALNNPVQSPCLVLAEDGCWKPGQLAELARVLVESRLMTYIRKALSCPHLHVAQAILRRYTKGGCRSHPIHTDHMAFGTAVADLTPMPGSGLFVCRQSEKLGSGMDGDDAVGGAFFVPFEAGDVAVHGWEVWHGIRLKEGHERVSLIVWVRPGDVSGSTVCTWYWAPALQNDLRAGYHKGIEAWRQRLLGHAKAALLNAVLEEGCAGDARRIQYLRTKLRALAGIRQAEAWYLGCVTAASQSQLGEPKLARRLRDRAGAQAAGSALQRWHRLQERRSATVAEPSSSEAKAAKASQSSHQEMRRAFERGWKDAQRDLPDFPDLPDVNESAHAARQFGGPGAARLLQKVGLVVFAQPVDALKPDLHAALTHFQHSFAAVRRELDRRGIALQTPFEFNEVCSRLCERYDLRYLTGKVMQDGFRLDSMPWKKLVYDVLGITVKEPYWP